ncbi:MAG: single-stranded-DNA-specific exonuclease RecJ [Thermoguttaceae bacterium]|jgi:single-stranded-DNA-specific exonuclease
MVQEKLSKIWVARPFDPDLVRRLARQTRIAPILAQTLAGRGIEEPDKIISFLAPPSLVRGMHPPSTLPGCEKAAKFLADAIRSKKKIVVYGDYDVDGMTATAILLQGIRACGGDCVYYVPNRLEEGYGLNCDALKHFKEVDEIDVVVTVDCGITSRKEADYARELGLEVVVTDHHTILVDEKTNRQVLPDVAEIVHPRLESEDIPPAPFPDICGAFVAFKLAWQLGVEMGPDGLKTAPTVRMFLLSALGLAALGTIADVMPMQDENRTLVRYALENSLVEHMPLGLKFLLECTSSKRRRLTSDDVKFTIAPRLNAAGREVLNENSTHDAEDQLNWKRGKELLARHNSLAAAGQMGLASLGVELLLTNQQARARELAPYINDLNATRQKLERRIMAEATKMIEEKYADAPAFVLARDGWHPGVIGIVAGRLAERYYRPTVMISLRDPDLNHGSSRGVPNSSFNMYNALEACSEHLVQFGGHAAAAGLSVKESNVPAFRKAFCDYVARYFETEDYVPRLYIDVETPLAALTWETWRELDKLAPFGIQNPYPVLAAYGLTLENVRALGANKNVLLAQFRQFQTTRRAVCFNRLDWMRQFEKLLAERPQAKYDVAFTLTYNDYVQQVEMRIQDWKLSEDSRSA